jgi:hypothetical protein
MAGRVQLATTGTQDVFFTENPEYTHFIKQFRKHTNFAMYDVKHDVRGEIGYGNTVKCTIPAGSGDLLKGVRVHIDLPALSAYRGYNESIGHVIIEYVNLTIGGQLVQRIPRDWLQIYTEHYITQTKQTALSKLIGKYPGDESGYAVEYGVNPINGHLGNATTSTKYIVDIPFYFHNHPALALPLCALTQQECEIEIKMGEVTDCIYSGHLAFDDAYDPAGTNYTFTVVEVNGVNKFHINGVDRPTLTFKRGSTYTFAIGETLNEAHPFQISETIDGTHTSGGVAYIPQPTLVDASTAVFVYSFTVPIDAPDYFYYYCAVHSGMGGQIRVINPTLDRTSLKIDAVSVHTELVQLDEPERVKLQSSKNEYIITQLQRNAFQIPVSTEHGRDETKCRLNFTNPVKELYFVLAKKNSSSRSVHPFDYDHTHQIYPPPGGVDVRYTNYENLVSLEMTLDNEVILDKITGNVINMRAVQSGIHHSRTQLFRRFYSYSFALEPERWYPTGQRNFSMIKDQNISLILNNDILNKRELRVYALGNNILRIQDGVGRLIFPNGPIGD